jgi:GNAT superfamily N-acetyltransferase
MIIDGPTDGASAQCEEVLRTLPGWFGIESSLLQYASDAAVHPTFVVRDGDHVVGFVTVREHFPEAWEVHCIAVRASHRGKGLGRALHEHVEGWLTSRSARFLQVKTMADSHPSPEYAETRRFYTAIGYSPLEVFPLLWGPRLPVLQLVKWLRGPAASADRAV